MTVLAELFRSRLRAKVLAWLFAHPDEQYYVRQLQSLIGGDPTNISRELARLEEIGVLTCQKEGRQKYYRANRGCPIYEELHGMVLKTEGLADVLREALESLQGKIDLCFVYGSHARGEATARSDVDLLVVGDLDEMDLHGTLSRAEERLHRTINYTLLSRREFRLRRGEQGGFIARILTAPRIKLIGNAEGI